uniref:30S ribosomal protein S1 n=1 Tax=Dasya binghamiae TaxID=1896963 RepID=A0A1C8XRX7_9FLOR|nr:30S ribosomal protein S1 [Dasya binghamiae]AOH77248.1 30S ribosomal protein S1 [Dasya binghamiae]
MIKINNKNSFADILKKYKYNLNPGDIVAGTIIHQEYKGFLVNIGDNISGYLPQEEIGIQFINNKKTKNLLLNITRDFFLIKHNTNIQQYILSIKRLEYIRSWKRIKQIQLENIIFNLNINYINKGGLITYLEGIQGFIPKSHLSINQNLSKLYNNKIKCKILIIDEQKNQLILSQKSALLQSSMHKFRIGELIYGLIVKIKNYGIFINIYGIIALLHISEIGSTYIKDLNTIFYVGKLIKIKIIHIDLKQGRLSVSKRNIKLSTSPYNSDNLN